MTSSPRLWSAKRNARLIGFKPVSDFQSHVDKTLRANLSPFVLRNRQIERHSRGRLAAAILVGWAYALVATATGTVLFSITLDGGIANMLKLLLISPALSAVAILTSAAVSGSSRNSTALGVVIMIPMIAPVVIFSGIYDAQSYVANSIWVNSLTSLLGLSIIYCTTTFFALPTILRAQT